MKTLQQIQNEEIREYLYKVYDKNEHFVSIKYDDDVTIIAHDSQLTIKTFSFQELIKKLKITRNDFNLALMSVKNQSGIEEDLITYVINDDDKRKLKKEIKKGSIDKNDCKFVGCQSKQLSREMQLANICAQQYSECRC